MDFIFETKEALKLFIRLNNPLVYGNELNEYQLERKANQLWRDIKGNSVMEQFLNDRDIIDLYTPKMNRRDYD